MRVSGGVPKSATSRAREDGRSLGRSGRDCVEIRFRYGCRRRGLRRADSGSLLRVTGRRESAARYESLSFEFSAATAQGPTLQVNKRRRLHTALILVMAPTPAGRGAQVRQASDAAGALHRVYGKAIATSRRLISTLGAPRNENDKRQGGYSPLMNSSKSALTLSGSTIAMPWEPPG